MNLPSFDPLLVGFVLESVEEGARAFAQANDSNVALHATRKALLDCFEPEPQIITEEEIGSPAPSGVCCNIAVADGYVYTLVYRNGVPVLQAAASVNQQKMLYTIQSVGSYVKEFNSGDPKEIQSFGSDFPTGIGSLNDLKATAQRVLNSSFTGYAQNVHYCA